MTIGLLQRLEFIESKRNACHDFALVSSNFRHCDARTSLCELTQCCGGCQGENRDKVVYRTLVPGGVSQLGRNSSSALPDGGCTGTWGAHYHISSLLSFCFPDAGESPLGLRGTCSCFAASWVHGLAGVLGGGAIQDHEHRGAESLRFHNGRAARPCRP